jgi:hypothetical protein
METKLLFGWESFEILIEFRGDGEMNLEGTLGKFIKE